MKASEAEVALTYFSRGIEFYNSGDYKKALICIDMFIAKNPDDLFAHNNSAYNSKALIYHKQGLHEDALDSINKAIAITPPWKGGTLSKKKRDTHIITIASIYNTKTTILVSLNRPVQDLIDCVDAATETISAINPSAQELVDFYYINAFYLANAERREEAIEPLDRVIALNPNYKDAHTIKGTNLCLLGNYDEAITSLDTAISRNEGDAKAHYYKSMAHYNKGEYQLAISSINKAVAIDSSNSKYLYMNSNILYRLERIDEALAIIEQALLISSDNSSSYQLKAALLHQQNRFEESIQAYEKALELEPDNAGTHYSKGLIHQAASEHEKAIDSFNKSISLNPLHLNARLGIVTSQYTLKHYDEAFQTAQDLIDVSLANVTPNTSHIAQAYNNQAYCLYAQNRYQEALAKCEQGIASNPNYKIIHLTKAEILVSLDDKESAILSYSNTLSIDPQDEEALKGRADLLQDLNRHGKAIESYQAAINVNSHNSDSHYRHAVSLYAVNRPKDAIKSLEKDTKHLHQNYCYLKARCHLALGQYQAALSNFNAFLKNNPDNVDAHCQKGNALHKLGKNAEALQSYNAAIRINPEHAYAHYKKACVHVELGEYQEAITHYTKAISGNLAEKDLHHAHERLAEQHHIAGLILYRSGQHKKAIASFAKALQFDQEHAYAHYKKACIHDELGEYQKAITHYKKAISLKPEEADFHYNLAAISPRTPSPEIQGKPQHIAPSLQAMNIRGS